LKSVNTTLKSHSDEYIRAAITHLAKLTPLDHPHSISLFNFTIGFMPMPTKSVRQEVIEHIISGISSEQSHETTIINLLIIISIFARKWAGTICEESFTSNVQKTLVKLLHDDRKTIQMHSLFALEAFAASRLNKQHLIEDSAFMSRLQAVKSYPVTDDISRQLELSVRWALDNKCRNPFIRLI
jgi:hypothetical protein